MRRGQLDPRFARTIADLYTQSPGAAAIAAEARRQGLGEVRLAGTTPFTTLVVDVPADTRLASLSAFASEAMDASVDVVALCTYPEWRRARIWDVAVLLAPGTT